MKLTEREKQEAIELFRSIQQRLFLLFEEIDGTARVQIDSWEKASQIGDRGDQRQPQVGSSGTTGVIRGAIVEKAGSAFFTSQGPKASWADPQFGGKPFFVAGMVTAAHLFNPHAPAAQMDFKLCDVGDGVWVGGSAGLIPMFSSEEDLGLFQNALAEVCSGRYHEDYRRFKALWEESSFMPLRGKSRGAAGIFFDRLEGDVGSLLSFLDEISSAYIKAYRTILRRRVDTPFSDGEKERQLRWRARYAEFNLIYDRGIKFCLLASERDDSLSVAMPPVVKW